MAAASTAGTIGHLSATFLPVFGIIAAFALTGNPVWGMGVAPAVIMMIICALLRGITRYIEQYLNHNVAFHLLALFRSKRSPRCADWRRPSSRAKVRATLSPC